MRYLKKLESFLSDNLITEKDYNYLKNINSRKSYQRALIEELIDLYRENKLYRVVSGKEISENMRRLALIKSQQRVVDDLIRLFETNRKKLNLKMMKLHDDFNISDEFKKGRAIVIDFETTSINVNSDVEILFFTALDTVNDRLITDENELIESLNNRLIVCHNVRFDFNCLKELLRKHSFLLVNSFSVVSSKSKNIVEYYVFENNDKRRISFFTYDTLNVFPVSLKTISELFIEFSRTYKFKYSEFIKEKGLSIEVEKNKADLSKIDFVNCFYEEVSDLKVRLYAKSDLGVKIICKDVLNEDLRTSENYRKYNLNDVYLTACVFLHFDKYYKEVFDSLGFNLNIKRKYTLAGISYDILLQLCKRNVVKLVKNGYIDILENKPVTQKRFSDVLKYCRKIEDNFYEYKTNIFYIDKSRGVFKIHMPYLSRVFKRAYKGGLVYFKDTDVHRADSENEIRQYDINSSYPFAMNYIEVNPYARIFCFKPEDFERFLIKYGKYMRENYDTDKYKFFDVIRVDELSIVKKYPCLRKMVELALQGKISVLIRGNLLKVNDSLYGINKKFKVLNKEFTANFYGKFNGEKVFLSLYDIIRADIDVEIKKIYASVNRNSILKDFIDVVYTKRFELKEKGVKFETALKLMLNSSYGKLGSCIDNVKKYSVCNSKISDINVLHYSIVFNAMKEFLNKPQYNRLTECLRNNEFSGVLDKHYKFMIDLRSNMVRIKLKSKTKVKIFLFTANMFKILLTVTTKKKYMTNNNVFMASQITAFGRLMLYTYAKNLSNMGADILYSDTDSITCFCSKKSNFDDFTGKGLGLLKFEKKAETFKAVKKKFYMIDNIKKAKGINKECVVNLDFSKKTNVVSVTRHVGKYENGVIKTIKLHVSEYKEVANCINRCLLRSIKRSLIESINDDTPSL